MTVGGWIVMIVSVGFVTGLLAWCITRVMREPDASEKIHSPVDIEPRDVEE